MAKITASLFAAIGKPINQDGTFTPAFVRLLLDIANNRRISTGPGQSMTIDGGEITLIRNFSYYSLDTESAAASDDLDTIKGGSEGDMIFLKAANSSRTIVVKDGSGNIACVGGSDLSLDNADDLVQMHYDGTTWKANLWNVSA